MRTLATAAVAVACFVSWGAASLSAEAEDDAATAAEAVEPAPTTQPLADAPATPDRFRVRIGNRMYPEWSDEVTVSLGESFFLGDTEFTAQAVQYLPDFRINKGEPPVSASMEPNNPALHVLVFQDGAPADSSWAFRNFPPHFSPKSFFTFQLLDLTPEGEADTEAAASPENPGEE